MRILLLNEYFPPDTGATAQMAAAVVEALAERHEVTVLCGRPSYDPSERHPFYLFRRGRWGKAVVERVGSTTFRRYRMLPRVGNYLSYVGLASLRALAVRADLIVAMTDPPFGGIVGAFIAWLKRRPFVYNLRDLYPEMALFGGVVRPVWWLGVWEKLHRWALGRARRIIVLGEDARERLLAKGIEGSRVVVVRDGACPSAAGQAWVTQPLRELSDFGSSMGSIGPQKSGMDRPGMTQDHPVTQQIRDGFSFVVLHAGNLGFSGAWETIIAAARLLDHEGVGFVFVGEGSLRRQLEASARDVDGIRFHSFQPPEQVPYVLAAGDLHLVTVKRGLEGVVVPSKLYSSLAAGRPVLVLAPEESDAARVVRQTGCGVVVDPDNPGAVASVIRELTRDRERLARMGEQALHAAQEFARERELQRFRRVIEEVASG
jgi:glycosyltransferase involved in cell wall biosynthesis